MLAVALLGLVGFILHGSSLYTGWRYDDPAHLRFVSDYAPWQYFSVRETMLEQSYAHITPWNALFYEIGVTLFGLDARGHHAHLLVIIWTTACVTWAFLRETLGLSSAWFGSILFLAMPSTSVMAQLLMTGHYAYGLLFSVLCMWCWSRAVSRESGRYAFIAAALYALACLCKELYVPLPLVLLFWPGMRLRLLMRLFTPVACVAVAYLLLRLALFGGVGGYAKLGSELDSTSFGFLSKIVLSLRMTVRAMLGEGALGLTVATLTAMALGLSLIQGKRVPLVLAISAVIVLLVPIVPLLTSITHDRIAFRVMVFVGWSAAVLLAWTVRNSGIFQRLFLTLIGLALVISHFEESRALEKSGRFQELENEFVISSLGDNVLVPRGFINTGYLRSILESREKLLGTTGPRIIGDEVQLVELGPVAGPRAFAWQEDCDCIRPIEKIWDFRADDYHRRINSGVEKNQAMKVEFWLSEHGLRRRLEWRVQGPTGRRFAELPDFGRFEVTSNGSVHFGADATFRLKDVLRLRFVIEDDRPDGSRLTSPLFEIPTRGNQHVSWPSTPKITEPP